MPRIAEGLHRLGSDLINFYLVEDATGVTVVDAGVPAFYDTLDELPRRVRPHAGTTSRRSCSPTRTSTTSASPSASAPSTACRCYVHAADETLAHTQKAPRDGSVLPYLRYPAAWKLVGVMAKAGPPGRVKIGEVTTFGAGDRLDVPGRPRVIHAPGHTDGCVALHFEGHQALLVGDVLCSRNPLTGRRGVQVMPVGVRRQRRAGARVDRPARGRRGRGDRLRPRRPVAGRRRRRARRGARHREDVAAPG